MGLFSGSWNGIEFHVWKGLFSPQILQNVSPWCCQSKALCSFFLYIYIYIFNCEKNTRYILCSQGGWPHFFLIHFQLDLHSPTKCPVRKNFDICIVHWLTKREQQKAAEKTEALSQSGLSKIKQRLSEKSEIESKHWNNSVMLLLPHQHYNRDEYHSRLSEFWQRRKCLSTLLFWECGKVWEFSGRQGKGQKRQ